jgi:hypothetical protein
VTAETEDLKEFFEERAAILEHDAGLPCAETELEAVARGPQQVNNNGMMPAGEPRAGGKNENTPNEL